MTTKRRGTANARHISTDDYALQQEALRIASDAIKEEAKRLNLVWPTSAMVERLTVFAEQMDDLHKRNSAQ